PLKELGSSQSVKSIIASMAIEGSLAGLDATVLNSSGVVQTAPPYNPTFPRLSDGEWQHTVQRVAEIVLEQQLARLPLSWRRLNWLIITILIVQTGSKKSSTLAE
ncbi:MAG: hypothetical protein RAM36_06530, partial [Arsenophonus sp.]|nr:hypothetical protein [Arsenophonus sp.]